MSEKKYPPQRPSNPKSKRPVGKKRESSSSPKNSPKGPEMSRGIKKSLVPWVEKRAVKKEKKKPFKVQWGRMETSRRQPSL